MTTPINLVEKLQASNLFKNIAAEDLEALIGVMERREYPAGTLIMQRGEQGDSMVEIIEGTIRVFTIDSEGNAVTLVNRGPGEVVGELSLIDNQPRSASAAAETDCKVLVLHRANFLDFLKDRPSVGMQMMLTLTGRIRYTTDYLQHVVDWIGRVSDGNFDAAMAALQSHNEEDSDMQHLIAAFIQMIHRVKERTS